MTKREMSKNKRAHLWIKKLFGKADHCENCSKTKATAPKTRFEWSNKDHKYILDRMCWQQLCSKCHARYDVRFNGKNKLSKEAKLRNEIIKDLILRGFTKRQTALIMNVALTTVKNVLRRGVC